MNPKLLFALSLFAMAMILGSCGNGYKEVTIAENFVIEPEWKEITPESPLPVEREYQYVRISVKEPFDAFAARGIETPVGEVVNPEIMLIGENENRTYQLVWKGADREPLGGEYVNYGVENSLPKHLKVSKVFIRSDVPIPTKKINWSVFNWRDVNTK